METKRFEKLLKDNHRFVTEPRLRLFAILQKHPALSMKELIRLLPKHDQVTVYRNMDLFERLGIITRLRLGQQTKIELSDMFRHHHHNFSCVNCGKVIDLPEDTTIEQHIRWLAAHNRFKATDHTLEIRGLCVDCQAKA